MTEEDTARMLLAIIEDARKENGTGYWDHDTSVVDSALQAMENAAARAVDLAVARDRAD